MLVRSRVFCSVPLVGDIKAVMLLLHDLFSGPYQGPSSLCNDAGGVQYEDMDRWWLSDDVKAVLAGGDLQPGSGFDCIPKHTSTTSLKRRRSWIRTDSSKRTDPAS